MRSGFQIAYFLQGDLPEEVVLSKGTKSRNFRKEVFFFFLFYWEIFRGNIYEAQVQF